MSDPAGMKPVRPRNVLMGEFPRATKEECSQALRDSSGDMESARKILKRSSGADPDSDTDYEDLPSREDPEAMDDEPPGAASDVNDEASEDEDEASEASDEEEDEDFEDAMARLGGAEKRRKRAARGSGTARAKLSEEEKSEAIKNINVLKSAGATIAEEDDTIADKHSQIKMAMSTDGAPGMRDFVRIDSQMHRH